VWREACGRGFRRHLANRHPELIDDFRAIIAASSIDEAAGDDVPPGEFV
jgi:hypothetical protein